MAHSGPAALAGRSVQVVSDLSLEEQLYLFQRARDLKAQASGTSASDLSPAPPLCDIADADVPLKVDDADSTVYLVFMEGSTRTKESLRNAAVYHGVKVNEFSVESSSFKKSETLTDTMKMLTLYSTQRSVFVLRSHLEGCCRWLQTVMPGHAEKFGVPSPSFLNAGDGRYSHPVGELADAFSLLEHASWDRSCLHIALVGDLAHGRTAHSKVDGLAVFKQVRVDLVTPPSLAYPIEYRNRMIAQGFEVREFSSVEEYLEKSGDDLATAWYFYKPQLSRLGAMSREAAAGLTAMVSFKAEWQSRLPAGACFFQTLPRDKASPIIDLALDNTLLNGWDRHASNTYFLHVVLLAMLFGKIGYGIPVGEPVPVAKAKATPAYPPQTPQGGGLKRPVSLTAMMSSVYPFAGEVMPSTLPGFLTAVDLAGREALDRPERTRPGGAVPVRDGLVIDHIGKSSDPEQCWLRLHLVRTILNWGDRVGSEGVYAHESKDGKVFRAVMCMPNFNFETVSVPQMKTLASVAPGCTINAVRDAKVVHKFHLEVPERIYNLPNIACQNSGCVSFPDHKQRDIPPYFERVPFYETSALPNCEGFEFLFVCRYCRWPHRYEDIWKV